MTRQQITKRVRLWQAVLGLTNWNIKIYFDEFQSKYADNTWEGIAKNDAQSQYKLASITFHSKLIKRVDDSVIVHELVHCLTASLIGMVNSNFDSKHRKTLWVDYFHEQLVSELERVIVRVAVPKKGEQIKI